MILFHLHNPSTHIASVRFVANFSRACSILQSILHNHNLKYPIRMLWVSSLQLFYEVVRLFGRLAGKRNGGPQRWLRGTEEERGKRREGAALRRRWFTAVDKTIRVAGGSSVYFKNTSESLWNFGNKHRRNGGFIGDLYVETWARNDPRTVNKNHSRREERTRRREALRFLSFYYT